MLMAIPMGRSSPRAGPDTSRALKADMTKKRHETAHGESNDHPPPRTRVRFDFVKSHAFRVIHVDGVWGGMRPDLAFHLSFYNERHSIPKSVTLDLNPTDLASEQFVEVEGRDAVIREVEVCAIISLETAEELRDWLNRGLTEAKDRLSKNAAESEEKQRD